jgi:DNA-binding transcriptional regulator YhcF (GntR family)
MESRRFTLPIIICIFISMHVPLDPASSVPLFHQIVVALKHMIAVGTINKGERLPSVKDASRLWHVHFHTVRRAYQALADEGLVLVGRGRPTTVVGDRNTPGEPELGAFLAQVFREARESFGLAPHELAQCLEGMTRPGKPPAIYMMECTEAQASALAGEIRERWGVETHGWALDRPGEPPPGLLISTFFHFQEMRSRWPGRLGDLHFVAIYPDPDLADRIRTRVGGTPERVLVCESEESMAENVAADLSAVLRPCGVRAEPCVIQDTRTPLELLEGGAICLFAPRIWGAVPTDVRDHPGAFEARYRIRPADLDALGSLIGARSDVPGGDDRSFA